MKPWLRICSSFEEEAEADREYWQQFSPEERVAHIAQMRVNWAAMNNDPMPASRDYVEFLDVLSKHEVRALVVGAYAIAFYAKPRYTDDLDIFVEASPDNAEKIVRALDEFGFGALGISPTDLSTRGDIVQLGFAPNRIDIITNISGVSFSEAWDGRVAGTLGGRRVFFIGKPELIRNKTASGRPKDWGDLDLLRRF